MITQDFKEKSTMQKAKDLFETNQLNYIIISDNLISYNIRENTNDSKEKWYANLLSLIKKGIINDKK